MKHCCRFHERAHRRAAEYVKRDHQITQVTTRLPHSAEDWVPLFVWEFACSCGKGGSAGSAERLGQQIDAHLAAVHASEMEDQ